MPMDGSYRAGVGGALGTAMFLAWLGYLYFRGDSKGQRKVYTADDGESRIRGDGPLQITREEHLVITTESLLSRMGRLLRQANLDRPENCWFNYVQNALEMLNVLETIPLVHRSGARDQVGIFLTRANKLLGKEILDKNDRSIARAYTNVATCMFIQAFAADLERPWETCFYLFHNALALLFQGQSAKVAEDVKIGLISCACRYLTEKDPKKVLECVKNYVAFIGERPSNEYVFLDLAQPLVVCGEYSKAIQIYRPLVPGLLKLPLNSRKILFRPVCSSLFYANSLLETGHDESATGVLDSLFSYLKRACKVHSVRCVLGIINRNRLLIQSENTPHLWLRVTRFQLCLMEASSEGFENHELAQMKFLEAVHLAHLKNFEEAMTALDALNKDGPEVFARLSEAFFQFNALKGWLLYNLSNGACNDKKRQYLETAIKLFEFAFEVLIRLGDYESERIIFIISIIQRIVEQLPEDSSYTKKYRAFPPTLRSKNVTEFPSVLVLPFWGLEIDFTL